LTLWLGATPAFLGELSWRFGLALAAINFVLIGLTFSSVNPRIGRNGNLLFSMFTFIVYYNLLNLGSSRIASGTADFWSFNMALHGGVFLCTGTLLAARHWNLGLRTPRPRVSATGASTI
jgi:lipopolysaccharide export system permease protein